MVSRYYCFPVCIVFVFHPPEKRCIEVLLYIKSTACLNISHIRLGDSQGTLHIAWGTWCSSSILWSSLCTGQQDILINLFLSLYCYLLPKYFYFCFVLLTSYMPLYFFPLYILLLPVFVSPTSGYTAPYINSFHGYKTTIGNWSLLGCYSTSTGKQLLTFQRIIVPSSSGSHSPSKLLPTFQGILNPEDWSTMTLWNVCNYLPVNIA
jgi:hypothetical protein